MEHVEHWNYLSKNYFLNCGIQKNVLKFWFYSFFDWLYLKCWHEIITSDKN